MRILYMTPGVFDKGGISRYGRFQIRALRDAYGKDSVEVTSLMGRQDGDFEDPFDVHFAGAVPLSRASRVLYAIDALRRAARFQPNVVLCALMSMGPLALACATLCGARLVQNIYGLEIWTSSGLTFPRRTALTKTDIVVADCHNTADRAIENGVVPKRPEVVWDCVDTERYSPGARNWDRLVRYGIRDNGKFKVLFLGRVCQNARHKGFFRLLRVVSRLPSHRFEVLIAGKGDDLDNVRQMARELGVADRTVVTGSIHENDMPDVYRAADAFYLVSEAGPGMGEGIPLTPMEAMSCGVPVLVGNQDGSRELLDGTGGHCSAPGALPVQCAYLESLAANCELHEREKLAARLRAVSAFGYERFTQETIAAAEKACPVSWRQRPR